MIALWTKYIILKTLKAECLPRNISYHMWYNFHSQLWGIGVWERRNQSCLKSLRRKYPPMTRISSEITEPLVHKKGKISIHYPCHIPIFVQVEIIPQQAGWKTKSSWSTYLMITNHFLITTRHIIKEQRITMNE